MELTRLEPDTSRIDPALLTRVRQTLACPDCDELPKVPDAGRVVDRDGVAVQVMHNGVLVEAGGYFGGWMSEIIRCLRGHHEPQEELVMARMLERLGATSGQTPAVVELGSFWAYYALWFLHELPYGRAVALEPDPANLALGRRNAALNARDVTFVHGVMGREPSAEQDFANLDGSVSAVRAYDLAGLLEQQQVSTVDLLLCDIQGGEGFLFEQAAGLLREGRVRFALVSTHHHSISGDALTHQRLLALLTSLGGHVVAEHTVGESCSGDGLIAVSFDPRDRDLTVPISHVRQSASLYGPMEHELAAALERAEQAELLVRRERARSASLQADLGAVQTLAQSEAGLAVAELARLRASRLFTWSERPRALYAVARSRAGR